MMPPSTYNYFEFKTRMSQSTSQNQKYSSGHSWVNHGPTSRQPCDILRTTSEQPRSNLWKTSRQPRDNLGTTSGQAQGSLESPSESSSNKLPIRGECWFSSVTTFQNNFFLTNEILNIWLFS